MPSLSTRRSRSVRMLAMGDFESTARKWCTYSPLHSVHDERSCAANADATEKDCSPFGPICATSDAEGAWSCLLLWLAQKRLRVGGGAMMEIICLQAGLDHVFQDSVSWWDNRHGALGE
jgi:hypothetical protein